MKKEEMTNEEKQEQREKDPNVLKNRIQETIIAQNAGFISIDEMMKTINYFIKEFKN
jgi:hypothetical protein